MSPNHTPAGPAQQGQVEYREIPGFPGYQAGSDGSIWSSYAGSGTRLSEGVRYKRLNGCRRKDGYRTVTLTRDGRAFHFLVHRLVLQTFIGPCPDGMESCHGDRDKANNRLANLRWDTHRDNIQDKFRHGTVLRGEQIAQAKLTALDVYRLRKLADYGVPGAVLAGIWGISRAEMGRIIGGVRWVDG